MELLGDVTGSAHKRRRFASVAVTDWAAPVVVAVETGCTTAVEFDETGSAGRSRGATAVFIRGFGAA